MPDTSTVVAEIGTIDVMLTSPNVAGASRAHVLPPSTDLRIPSVKPPRLRKLLNVPIPAYTTRFFTSVPGTTTAPVLSIGAIARAPIESVGSPSVSGSHDAPPVVERQPPPFVVPTKMF